MRLSVLQSNFRGYSCIYTMMGKWKNLNVAIAFQIFCVYFKQISVEKTITASCELFENVTLCFLNRLVGPLDKNKAVPPVDS